MSHETSNAQPRIAVITCAVLEPEIAHFAQGLSHIARVEVLEQGLHTQPDKLRTTLQEAIDRIEAETDADVIVLGYGLCSRGTEGVHTRRCRLVIPRAHDCITILLGDKDRYARYVAERPGTYWYSPGWNKHTPMPGKERYEELHRKYTEEYGEDNAQFLMDTEQNWYKTYSNAAFVHLGVGDIEKEWQYTQQCAEWLGWQCDYQCGDPALLKDLMTGPWDDRRFLVLAPGETFRTTADDRVIEKENKRVPGSKT